jgi:hypothetical protein
MSIDEIGGQGLSLLKRESSTIVRANALIGPKEKYMLLQDIA